MRQTILAVMLILLVQIGYSQEAADRKVQAGLIFGTGMNLIQSKNTKLIDSKGFSSVLNIGANVNYSFSSTLGFNTGVEFDFSNYRTVYSNQLFYSFDETNQEIYSKSKYLDGAGVYNPPSSAQLFEIEERKAKNIYLTVPTMFIFRTKFIGYFRYFGKFGLRNSFLLKSEYFDKGKIIGNLASLDHMQPSKRDLALYNGSLGISAGAEWNFSGSTCLVAELGYYYGLTNVTRNKALTGDAEKNMNLYTTYVLQPSGFTNTKFNNNQLLLKISILF